VQRPDHAAPSGAVVAAPAVELKRITVRFGHLLANDSVDFDLKQQEIHALLGENGAGKTTLMRVLGGLIRPDAGRVLVHGEPVELHSAADAARRGIGMVHQHFMLIPTLTVAENVTIGLRSAGYPFPDFARVAEELQELGRRYGLAVHPEARVGELSVSAQQRVEILKALYRGARTLVLDEPTAVLTPQEARGLFDVIESLIREGSSVVFISHKLDEVMRLSDRVTVLRRGRAVASLETAATSARALATLMVGRELKTRSAPTERRVTAEPTLGARRLLVVDERGVTRLDDFSLEIRPNEIVGLAGVDGNGQSELCDVLAGLRRPQHGQVFLAEREISGWSIADRLAAGLAVIAEDRHKRGVVLDASIADNAVAEVVGSEPYSRRGFLNRAAIDALAQRLIADYDIRCLSRDQDVRALSGGNQQKLVLAREMFRRPRVLVAMQPTRGLDVGASEQIHDRLLQLRDQGTGILLVSTELDEIFALADRIVVIYEGKALADLQRHEATTERVGLLMAGKAA
jgi:simple sugar transport system ATP-binding protein